MEQNPPTVAEHFWQQAASGTLIFQSCDSCDCRFHYPRIACPDCGSQGWSWFESAGVGRVHSYTVVHRTADPRWKADVPFTVVLVDMDDLDHGRLLGSVVGAEQPVEVGTRVTVVIEAVEGEGFPPANITFEVAAQGGATGVSS